MKRKSKKVNASRVETAHLVLPANTNHYGNVAGGQLMYWMDIAGGISAEKHCEKSVVTAHVSQMDFKKPVKLGEIVIIKACLTSAFMSSMEVLLEVFTENPKSGARALCNTAFFVFVAVNAKMKPSIIPKLVCESPLEKKHETDAIKRKQLRQKAASNKF